MRFENAPILSPCASPQPCPGAVFTVAATEPHVLGAPTHRYKLEFKGFRLPLDRPYAGESTRDLPLFRFGAGRAMAAPLLSAQPTSPWSSGFP